MKIKLIIVSILAVVSFGVLFVINNQGSKQMDVSENMSIELEDMNKEMAVAFELKDLDGNIISLVENNGEKVYVKFWASWCSICLAGLDELDELSGMDNDFKVYTIISPDYNGEKSEEKFRTWFEKQDQKNLIVLIDDGGIITRSYEVRGYPTSAFIGSDGSLIKTIPGHLSSQNIIDEFKNIE